MNATFEIQQFNQQLTILWHGRWRRHHNRDYLPALEVVLSRLKSLDATITDALVDTLFTRRWKLSMDQCRLPVRDRHYPIYLRDEPDMHAFRLAILHMIGKVGLPPDRTGGHTPLKQLRIFLAVSGHSSSSLAKYLSQEA